MERRGSVYEAFGLAFESGFPLPFHAVDGSGSIDLVLAQSASDEVARRFSGARNPRAVQLRRLGGGGSYSIERGLRNDFIIEYVDRASFHISPDASRIACAPADPSGWEWRQFLLDSVLGFAALVRGFEALHAASWLEDDGVIAVVAGAGGGKTTLLAESIRSGRMMFCDDILVFARIDGEVVAMPGPPLMNLPARMPDGTPASAFGEVLATIGGECWTLIDRPRVAATAVGSVIFLDRRAGAEPAVERLSPSPSPLLAHSLISGRDPERLTRRFDLFAALALTTAMLTVTVAEDTPPAAIARLIERSVAS